MALVKIHLRHVNFFSVLPFHFHYFSAQKVREPCLNKNCLSFQSGTFAKFWGIQCAKVYWFLGFLLALKTAWREGENFFEDWEDSLTFVLISSQKCSMCLCEHWVQFSIDTKQRLSFTISNKNLLLTDCSEQWDECGWLAKIVG